LGRRSLIGAEIFSLSKISFWESLKNDEEIERDFVDELPGPS